MSVICTVCVTRPRLPGAHSPGHFSYDISKDEIFSQTGVTTREFRNLRSHLKRHFEHQDHCKTVKLIEIERSEKEKMETREFSVGMRISRICYAMYKCGSSKRDFEAEILKAVINGADLGNINHKEFPTLFRPYVADEVNKSLSSFFQSRLKCTGFKPPVNVQADKGTNCHRTRQFTSLITIVPGTSDLITFVYLGQPVVKEHDDVGITRSIANELISWKIDSAQIEDGSFDRQYFHLSVPQHLSDHLHLPRQFLSTWDPLQKGGLVDTPLRADVTFAWLVQIQATCKQIYTLFNWGKNYEELGQVCEDMDMFQL